MHQPAKVGKQSVQTVISDLEAQASRLADAIIWTRNVAKAVAEVRGVVLFTNAGPIEPGCREVGIALGLPFGGLTRDVLAFTLVSTPTEDELAAMRQETALAGESLRLANLLNWQAQGVKTFETWFVPEKSLWQDTPEATQIYLNRMVKSWMNYWFENPPTPLYRRPKPPSIQPLRR